MVNILELIILFFLGSSIGSFLMCGRVVGRSKCDGCERELCWHELIPVVSWLVNFVWNKGKIKCCGRGEKSLSWKYLFGEIILGLWFVGYYLFYSVYAMDLTGIFLFLGLIFGSIFFVLVMEDLGEMQVSEKYLYGLVCVGIVGALYKFNFYEILFPILIFSPYWLIYFLGKYLDKPMIGEADPYVFSAIGIFFGTQFSISLFLYSVWLGACIGIAYLIFVNKNFERNIRLPYLPIIFIACLFILIFDLHIIKIQDILFLYESFYSY